MENSEIMDNAKKKHKWHRLFFMLIFFAISEICKTVLFLIVVFQFFHNLILNKTNEKLLSFSEQLVAYFKDVYSYLTYVHDEKPFPFNDWPSKKAIVEPSKD